MKSLLTHPAVVRSYLLAQGGQAPSPLRPGAHPERRRHPRGPAPGQTAALLRR